MSEQSEQSTIFRRPQQKELVKRKTDFFCVSVCNVIQAHQAIQFWGIKVVVWKVTSVRQV